MPPIFSRPGGSSHLNANYRREPAGTRVGQCPDSATIRGDAGDSIAASRSAYIEELTAIETKLAQIGAVGVAAVGCGAAVVVVTPVALVPGIVQVVGGVLVWEPEAVVDGAATAERPACTTYKFVRSKGDPSEHHHNTVAEVFNRINLLPKARAYATRPRLPTAIPRQCQGHSKGHRYRRNHGKYQATTRRRCSVPGWLETVLQITAAGQSRGIRRTQRTHSAGSGCDFRNACPHERTAMAECTGGAKI